MTRKVSSVLLMAAVVVYPAAFLESFENPTSEMSLTGSGETDDLVQGVSSPESPKAPLWAPPSALTTFLPAASLLHQRLILEDWEIVSHFGGSTRLGRSPPLA